VFAVTVSLISRYGRDFAHLSRAEDEVIVWTIVIEDEQSAVVFQSLVSLAMSLCSLKGVHSNKITTEGTS
jgi:hypothetical protein